MNTAPVNTVAPTRLPHFSLRLIGTPDRRMVPTSGVILDPAAGAEAWVLQGTHNLNQGRAALVQPATGKICYLDMPGASGSWAVYAGGGGDAWLGSHQSGFLYQLKAGASELRRIPLPSSCDPQKTWVWSIDRASDGGIYLGTYPEGALLRYDPTTDSISDLGPVNPDSSRAHYIRSITGQFPGKLYLGMGAVAELIEYDLATGEKTRLVPEACRSHAFVYHVERVGDWLAAGIAHHDAILLLDPDSRQIVHQVNIPGHRNAWLGNPRSFVWHEEELYFTTGGDDTLWSWSPDSQMAREIRTGVGRLLGLADGGHWFCLDAFGVFRVLNAATGETVASCNAPLEGEGMALHALATGPGESVVGGIYINQGFFAYDAGKDTLFQPGAAISYSGQIDSLTTLGSRVLLAHYTTARLSLYDPEKDWDPGLHSGANPHLIGEAGQEQDRFPCAITGSDGRAYLGSIPDYGKLGGALVSYDPAAGTMDTRRHLVSNQSIYSLAEIDGVLCGGTSIKGGLGSAPVADEALLFAWDMQAQAKRWELPPLPGAREIWGLATLPDQLLIGAADNHLFRFDPASRTTTAVRENALPDTITILCNSRDGWVYGLTESSFFRISPDLQNLEIIEEHPDYWDHL